jgi:hypothetical protein
MGSTRVRNMKRQKKDFFLCLVKGGREGRLEWRLFASRKEVTGP